MSRRKRRKIQSQKETKSSSNNVEVIVISSSCEEEEDQTSQEEEEERKIKQKLKAFRDEITQLLSEKKWNLCIRNKIVMLERSKERVFDVKIGANGVKYYHEYTWKRRKRVLLSLPNEERLFRLRSALRTKKITITVIKMLYKRYIGDHTSLSRDILLDDLSAFFYDKPVYAEKRAIERQIISEYDSRLEVVELCGISIPKDVLIFILSFLDYNSVLLFETGRVNKMFYVTILSTWRSIKLERKKIPLIPLLVLNSVKEIVVTKSSFSKKVGWARIGKPKKTVTVEKDIEYIINHLNYQRLRSIVFLSADLLTIRTFFDVILRLKKKEGGKGFAQHVQKLSFTKCYRYMEELGRYHLNDLFPSLQTLENPPTFKLVESAELDHLEVRLNTYSKYSHELIKELSSSSLKNVKSVSVSDDMNYMEIRGAFDKFIKSVNVQILKKLRIHHIYSWNIDQDYSFVDRLNEMKCIEVLHLDLSVRRNNCTFIFPTNAPPLLRELKINFVTPQKVDFLETLFGWNQVRNFFCYGLDTVYGRKYGSPDLVNNMKKILNLVCNNVSKYDKFEFGVWCRYQSRFRDFGDDLENFLFQKTRNEIRIINCAREKRRITYHFGLSIAPKGSIETIVSDSVHYYSGNLSYQLLKTLVESESGLLSLLLDQTSRIIIQLPEVINNKVMKLKKSNLMISLQAKRKSSSEWNNLKERVVIKKSMRKGPIENYRLRKSLRLVKFKKADFKDIKMIQYDIMDMDTDEVFGGVE